ncbi:MAG: C40 family peptidase [Pseudomonadota bacterium]
MKILLIILALLHCSAALAEQAPEPVGASQNDVMNDLAIYAMSLSDTPYQYGGNTSADGFDCSGFVRYVFSNALSLQLPRTSHEMSRIGAHLEPDQLRPGDLVFYNTRKQRYSHVGIYVGDDRFVHASSSGKSIALVNMQDTYWRTRYNGARRVSVNP